MSIRSWLKRRRLDEDDLDEEIRAHLAIAAREKEADGADPEEATLQARKEFGNVLLTREAARRVFVPGWLEALEDLLGDVRVALRTLAKNASFSLTVVGVLALGVGLNAAVFTMLKGVALSPIAGVEGARHLFVVFGETSAGRPLRLSYPDYVSLRDHDRAFSGLFGTSLARVNLGRGRGARQVWSELVTHNYFEVLGVRAQRGRTLTGADEAGMAPVVVLSDGLWRREFGADPDVVGRTVEVNNQTLTIAGVAEPAFHGTTVVYDIDLYLPVTLAPALGFTFGSQETTPAAILADRRASLFFAQGYLRPGATPAQAGAETKALGASLARERQMSDTAQRLRVVPFWRMPGGAPLILMPTLGVLIGMGLLVLLIACANIAGLVLVRGLSRRGEIAVRQAIGATRGRVVRLMLVENLVLALPSAALGVLVARQAVPLLAAHAERMAAPDRVFFNIGVDALVIAFAAVVACFSALAFGLVPAREASRVDLLSVINEDASSRTEPRGRLRYALVVAQVAVSLMLLMGSGLATRSVDAARRAHPGFEARQVALAAVDVKQNAYDEARGRVFYRKLLDAARSDPGVESATLAEHVPLAFLDTRAHRVSIEGYEPRRGEDLAFPSNTVAPDYFRTLRIPVAAGREFEDRDDETGAPVLMVNDTFARRFWGGARNAIGKRVRIGDRGWRTVVGVAADLKYSRIDEAPRPYLYLPFLQSYRSSMVLHTRGRGSEDDAVQGARALVAALDGDLPILEARTLTQATRGALILLDLAATVLFVFGLAGMALAALGTYGLVSYVVTQSTREIGIRMVLGASTLSVVGGFVARGLRLGAIGAVLGTLAALALTGLLGHVLFGVSAHDPLSFARALGVVFGGVILATLVPAWRAARTNPLTALRHQ
jgi:predicted permease